MQIQIVKADGTAEPYLHTKVLGSFNHALAMVHEDCLYTAEQLSEAVTFYLYRKVKRGTLTSDEIHLMIISVLTSTGFEHAAQALTQHRLERRLKRKRIEVTCDGESGDNLSSASGWDKSHIVQDLMYKQNFDRLLARAIAAAVEEKVLNMNITKIRKSLIRQLVLIDTESLLEASHQLAAAEYS